MKSIDKRVGTLMLSLALSVASVCAQTVDDICINNVRQLGGKEAAAKVKSLQLQETVVTEGSELQVTTLLVPGVAYYQRIKSPQGTSMVCAYGEQGWIFNSTPTPRTEQLPDGMAQTYIIGSKFLGPLFDYCVNQKASDVSMVKLIGKRDLDGEACYELQANYKSGCKLVLCVSCKDGLIRQTTSPAGVIRYEDYRNVGGVMVPHMVLTSCARGLILTKVNSAQVNVDLEGQLLAKP